MENIKNTTEDHFDSLISEAMKIGVEKMSQYGTSWTSYEPDDLMVRMFNKAIRIATIIRTKENKVGEKISGEFKEILNYATLLCMMVENEIEIDEELEPVEVTKFREITFKKVKDLMIKKNHDYGEAWRKMTQSNINSEIKVKIRRIRRILETTQKSPIDNIYDIINYCAFALILIEENVHSDL